MKGEKQCWNCCCICWVGDLGTSNCAAEDIPPEDCRLSDVDLRSALNLAGIYHTRNGTTHNDAPESFQNLLSKWNNELKKIDLDAKEGVPDPVAWAQAKTLDDCITQLMNVLKKKE
jgi:hypothetical protein